MNYNSFTENAISLIKKNRLDEAIEVLFSHSDERIKSELILQQRRLAGIKKDYDLEIVNRIDYDLTVNRITFAILNLLTDEFKNNSNFEEAEQLYNFGFSLLIDKQYLKSIEYFSKSIELNPFLCKAYIDRGAANCAINNFNEAISDFNFSLNLSPKQVFAYFNRGIAFFNLQNIERAYSDWQKVKELGFDIADDHISLCINILHEK